MKLVKDDLEILVSEIKKKKPYIGWHLHFTCEECGKNVIAKDWYRYKKKIEKNEYLCQNCTSKRTFIQNYGCEYPSQNEEVKEKKKKSFLNRYGVENPAQSEEIKGKIKATNLEKYGTRCPLQNAEVQKKTRETNLKKYNCEHSAQNAEVQEKTKQTNLKKYNCEHPVQNAEVQKKIKETNLNRYNAENPQQNAKIREKTKQTNLKRYGTECSLQNEEVKEKIKQTNLEKYGVEYLLQSEEIKNKVKQTNLDRYGCDNVFQNEEIKQRIKQKNLKEFGVEFTSQRDDIKQKIRENNFKKYNANYPMQIEEIKQKAKVKALENNFLSLYDKFTDLTPLFSINEYNGIDKKYPWKCECGHEFYDHLNNGRKPRCYECYPRQKQTSQYENQIIEFLEELGINNIISNSRDIIAPQEIDIYLSDYNLAIEFNGLWWHSNEYKDKFYHLDKTKKCLEKGIDLIHVYEDEWIEKNDIVKSIIKSKLGISDKIYARKCIVGEISKKDIYEFLELNHIQGFVNSKFNYGLYYDDELVSLLCLGKSRFNKQYDYEIYRFCNRLNTSVVGGFLKLLKHFEKEYSGSIITYADKRYFTGDIYRNNEFEELESSRPNYFYVKGEKRYGRLNFQKHKLKEKLDEFYEELTESENMVINGYTQIYDCGNYVFAKI